MKPSLSNNEASICLLHCSICFHYGNVCNRIHVLSYFLHFSVVETETRELISWGLRLWAERRFNPALCFRLTMWPGSLAIVFGQLTCRFRACLSLHCCHFIIITKWQEKALNFFTLSWNIPMSFELMQQTQLAAWSPAPWSLAQWASSLMFLGPVELPSGVPHYEGRSAVERFLLQACLCHTCSLHWPEQVTGGPQRQVTGT